MRLNEIGQIAQQNSLLSRVRARIDKDLLVKVRMVMWKRLILTVISAKFQVNGANMLQKAQK